MTEQASNDSPEVTAAEAAPTEDPRHTSIIDARLADLTARFADRFSDEERAQVRARIARAVTLGEKMRRTPLTNDDEPEIVFVPYRTEA